jgi:hypothetical protein
LFSRQLFFQRQRLGTFAILLGFFQPLSAASFALLIKTPMLHKQNDKG